MSQLRPISPGYLDLKRLAAYCGLSERTLRDCLNDGLHPLPHYRLKDRGKVLVKVAEFDEWFMRWRSEGSVKGQVDQLLAEMEAEMLLGKRKRKSAKALSSRRNGQADKERSS